MRNRLLGVLAAAAAITVLVPERTSEAQSQVVINFGTMAPDGTPWSDQLKSIKSRVEKESGGRVKFKLFLGGSLGAEVEMMQDVVRGERLQGGGFSTGAIGEALDVPVLLLPELPYLFSNTKQADAVLDGVLTKPVTDALAAKGITFYAWAENGWRNMGTKGGPAATLEDVKKYKMRSQESPVHLDMWKALGVQAVPKPTTEVLPALNTGIVDGYDNSPLFSLAGGLVQPITHYTLTQHIYQPAAVVYSKKFMDGVPADLKPLLLKDAAGEAARGRTSVRNLEKELLDTIRGMGKTVVVPTAEQKAAFQKATLPVHKAFLAKNPALMPLYQAAKAAIAKNP